MLARICMAAQAEVIGASVSEKAIRIAMMVRRRRKCWILQKQTHHEGSHQIVKTHLREAAVASLEACVQQVEVSGR